MIKLYYVPQTRAGRVRWMLEELGVPHELVRLDVAKKENHAPEYLRLHPLGHVPALIDGAVTMFESSAIVHYLAEKFPEKRMLPAPGTAESAHCHQWIAFLLTELEPQSTLLARHTRWLPEAERLPQVAQAARAKLTEALAALEAAVGQREFLVGDRLTIADILVGSAMALARVNGLLEGSPNLAAYAKRMAARPAFQRSRAD